jgi:hypothetical protein
MAADFFDTFKSCNERDDVRENCSTFAKVIISRHLRQKNHHNLIFQMRNAILLSDLSCPMFESLLIRSRPIPKIHFSGALGIQYFISLIKAMMAALSRFDGIKAMIGACANSAIKQADHAEFLEKRVNPLSCPGRPCQFRKSGE